MKKILPIIIISFFALSCAANEAELPSGLNNESEKKLLIEEQNTSVYEKNSLLEEKNKELSKEILLLEMSLKNLRRQYETPHIEKSISKEYIAPTSILEPTATSIPKSNPDSEKVTFEILDKHPDFECLSIELNKFINVFGVYVISHDSIPEEFMVHTANILAEFLDNDLDGIPDDMNVINSLRDNNYVVPVWSNETNNLGSSLRDMHFYYMRGTPCEDNISYAASMYYLEDHWSFGGIIESGVFDTNIEEVWHVVSRGWYDAYPEYFGVEYENISKLNKAMDLARGGKFEDLPSIYPEDAWYSYYDVTCDYSCQASEYFYWAVAANIGALDPVYTNKCESSKNEWNICTKEELKEKDPHAYQLLNDFGFILPKNIPLGKYIPDPNSTAKPTQIY
tara:strand:+ start:363 stop:1547 length:1185 start_codon:yes stop_codon:yes gene_type:complete